MKSSVSRELANVICEKSMKEVEVPPRVHPITDKWSECYVEDETGIDKAEIDAATSRIDDLSVDLRLTRQI